ADAIIRIAEMVIVAERDYPAGLELLEVAARVRRGSIPDFRGVRRELASLKRDPAASAQFRREIRAALETLRSVEDAYGADVQKNPPADLPCSECGGSGQGRGVPTAEPTCVASSTSAAPAHAPPNHNPYTQNGDSGMSATTTYGHWTTLVDHTSSTLERTVLEFISGADRDWISALKTTGALDRIIADYRDEINNSLPPGVVLTGSSEFIGPFEHAPDAWDGYPVTDTGDLDIAAIVRSVDLSAIVERHDPDKQ